MNIFVSYRLYYLYLMPFIVLCSSSFIAGFVYMWSFFIIAVLSVLSWFLSQYLFPTVRMALYMFCLLFLGESYMVFSIFYYCPPGNIGISFFPFYLLLLPLVLVFQEEKKDTHLDNYPYLGYSIFILCTGVSLPVIGFLREVMCFHNIRLLSIGNTHITLPLQDWMHALGLDCQNTFFLSSAGGMILLSIIVMCIAQSFRSRYDV